MLKTGDDIIYQRGKYRLEWDRKRDGTLRSPYPQIVWYDEQSGRNRSKSTGTSIVRDAEEALDRLYLERERGSAICAACGQPIVSGGNHPVSAAIADYLVARADRTSIDAIRPRLAHVLDWLDDIGRANMTPTKPRRFFGLLCAHHWEDTDRTIVRSYRPESPDEKHIVASRAVCRCVHCGQIRSFKI